MEYIYKREFQIENNISKGQQRELEGFLNECPIADILGQSLEQHGLEDTLKGCTYHFNGPNSGVIEIKSRMPLQESQRALIRDGLNRIEHTPITELPFDPRFIMNDSPLVEKGKALLEKDKALQLTESDLAGLGETETIQL